MKNYYNVNTVWIVMMLLTISTYVIGELGFSSVGAVLFLLLTALIKGSLIIREFMELRDVALLWRVLMYGWLWTICSIIAICYVIGL